MFGIGTCSAIAFALFANKAKPSIAGLTTIAALPQAGGQASSLPPERNEGWDGIMKEGEEKLNALGYQVKDGQIEKVQMKAPYFDWEAETPLPAIDLGFVGGMNADENQG